MVRTDFQSETQRASAEDATGEADQDVIAARAAAMLPAELLQPHEIIILLLKPSPWFIVLAPLKTLVTLAILTLLGWLAAGMYVGGPVAQRDVVVLGIALIGFRLFWQFLEWLSRVYVLTDQRMIRVRGVLRVQVFECQLKQIQHTEASFSIRERVFALGTIAFATAGTALAEVYWSMLARPLEVHQRIVQTLRRYRR